MPAFLQRNRDAAPAPSRPAPEPGGNQRPSSLAGVRNLLLLAGAGVLVVSGYVVFQLMALQVVHSMEQEAAVTADLVAARMSALAAYYGDGVARVATDPETVALLSYGDAAQVRSREQSLRYVFADASAVRLLPRALTGVDAGSSGELGYAALAQLRESESGNGAPPAEVHQINSPEQHVNIVRRVMDASGGRVAGHIMLSLPGKALQDALAGLQVAGYVEVQQDGDKGEPAVVARHGDTALRTERPERVAAVPGSRWQVAYWPATGSIAYLGSAAVQVMAVVAVAALVLTALIVMLFRRLSGGVRLNEVSMTMLMKDFRDGHVGRSYPCGLSEMRDTIEFMVQLAAGAQNAAAKRRPVAREQDGDVAEEQLADSINGISEQAQRDDSDGARAASDFSGGVQDDSLLLEEDGAGQAEQQSLTDASIFRAYDIRGVVDRTLTVDAVRLIGMAIGSEALQLGRNVIVVGRDGRLSGPKLAAALIEGILATGCNVKDIGCVPTPVLYFATHHLDTQSGVMVTGSHNPPDYNGLKIVIDGETLSGESIQGLRERIESRNFISGQGRVEQLDVVPDYIERIRGDVTLARPLRVVIDCGNGVAGGVAPQLLRRLGCEVFELFCEVDGNFPNHHPDPSRTENLQDLIAAVAGKHADIGLAFDGDGDRLGVVTPSGKVIWPDRVLMLYAMDILDRNPGGLIIYDVKCTRHLDGIIREHGGQPLMWKTGHSFIKAKIRNSGALLAGEMSGHIFIKERWYGFDDGLYAAARLLEILARDPQPVDTVFAALPDSVNTPELNVAMREGEPAAFINNLLAQADFADAKISTIDGLRADFPDGWGLVRASNTTPVLVLRFEADDDDALERIKGDFRRVMLQVRPDLSLPF